MNKPQPQYEVELSSPNSARSSLLRVWKNLDVRGELETKFKWTYEVAPHVPDTAFLLKLDDQVVGSAGFGVRTFRVFGADKRVAVMADLAVDAEHRSLAPALSLVKAGREFVQKQFDFAYGWPNSKAEGVFARARYKSLGRLYRYVRVLRYEAYMDRAVHYTDRLSQSTHLPPRFVSAFTKPPLAAIGMRALTLGNRIRHRARALRFERDYSLQWTTTRDSRIDAIWQTARDEYGIVCERTSRFLTWRFANEPVRVAVMHDEVDHAPVAYAVIRMDGGDAQIVDVFGKHNALAPLLNMLIAALGSEGEAHAVSCTYLGQSRFLDVLEECGFEKRDDKGRSVYMCNGQLPQGESPRLEQAENWHLTAFDEDV